jgi:hypothetical protein
MVVVLVIAAVVAVVGVVAVMLIVPSGPPQPRCCPCVLLSSRKAARCKYLHVSASPPDFSLLLCRELTYFEMHDSVYPITSMQKVEIIRDIFLLLIFYFLNLLICSISPETAFSASRVFAYLFGLLT